MARITSVEQWLRVEAAHGCFDASDFPGSSGNYFEGSWQLCQAALEDDKLQQLCLQVTRWSLFKNYSLILQRLFHGEGTLGGYVCENYLGTLCAVRWLFSQLNSFLAEDPEYEAPAGKETRRKIWSGYEQEEKRFPRKKRQMS